MYIYIYVNIYINNTVCVYIKKTDHRYSKNLLLSSINAGTFKCRCSVFACMHAFVHACVHACVHVFVCAHVCLYI